MYYTFYKNYGSAILLRYKENGKTFSKKLDIYKPKLYVPDEQGKKKTIFDVPVKPIKFDSIRDARDFVKQYTHTDLEFYGNSDFGNAFVIELLEGKTPEYNASDIKAGIIDIEVDAPEMPKATNAVYPITAITTYDSVTKTFDFKILKCKETDHWCVSKATQAFIKELNITPKVYDDERVLLSEYIQYFKEQAFDFTSGWNSELFDMPYIVKRIEMLLGEKAVKQLSPFGIVNERMVNSNFGNKELKVNIMGVPHLDYMALYKKHIFTPRDSYKLDAIAEAEIGHKKLSYEESGNLRNLYRDDFQLYGSYNIQDVNLIRLMEEKLRLFDVTFALSYFTLGNYEDTLGTVVIWEKLIAKSMFSKDIVPLFKRKDNNKEEFEGAFVVPTDAGKHHSIISVDLNSLYPHIEMQINIGSETYIEPDQLPNELLALKQYTLDDLLEKKVDLSVLKKYNVSMSPSFSFYKKDRMSLISEIKRELYSNRKGYKKQMLEAEQKKSDCEKDSEEYKKYSSAESMLNNMQMAMKILLNSGYGSLGTPSFLYYKLQNAESITTMGQYVNRYTTAKLEKYLQKLLNTNQRLHTYGDTDSVVGSTLIYVNGAKIKIEDYFDSSNGDLIVNGRFNDDYVKVISNNDTSLSVNSETKTCESKRIKYVMKHKVKKRMFKIIVDDKDVIVTEDHSIIVERNNRIVSVKPNDILKTDVIITLVDFNMSVRKYYEIIDLGEQEQFVYDIEVEDNHNFFANDILVHNSAYFKLHPLIERLGLSYDKDKDKIVKVLDKFVKEKVEPKIEEISNEICDYLNNYEQKMRWSREVIAESAVFVTKKRYAMKVWDSEGVSYKEAKIKITGLESKKSSTPAWARGFLKEAYTLALEKDEKAIVDFVKHVRERFNEYDVNEIAIPTGVNKLQDYTCPVNVCKKGTQMHIRSALYHNKMLKDKNIKSIEEIKSGNKIRYLILNPQNPYGFDCIGFETWLPKEFGLEKYVDRNALFGRGFISPLENFLIALGWEHEEKIDVFDSMFD